MAEITYDMLVAHGACTNRDTFKELFGDKAVITPTLARKHATEFDWNWAAENLLTPTLYKQWEDVLSHYRDRHSAEIRITEHNYRYTPGGKKRSNHSEKQRTAYRAKLDALHREVREKEAEVFAHLYINRNRSKITKTEKLMDQLRSKVDKLIREVFESNEKDGFMADPDMLTYRVEQIVNGAANSAESVYRGIRNERRRRAREAREAQRSQSVQAHSLRQALEIQGVVNVNQATGRIFISETA